MKSQKLSPFINMVENLPSVKCRPLNGHIIRFCLDDTDTLVLHVTACHMIIASPNLVEFRACSWYVAKEHCLLIVWLYAHILGLLCAIFLFFVCDNDFFMFRMLGKNFSR